MKKKPLGRIRSYFLRTTVISSLLACLVCVGVFTVYSHAHVTVISRESMRDEEAYVARGVEREGLAFLQDLPQGKTRITWIGADGAVLYDSVTPAEQMENHADREEVQAALATGAGESVRYSSTLSEKTVNRAVRLSDGTVLRLSMGEETTLMVLGRSAGPVLIILSLAVAGSVLIGSKTSRDLVRPINELDLTAPSQDAVYEELRPLVRRINAQNEQLQARIREQEAEHEAQDKFRREFTANVSHELKTPLTSISGFAEIIRDGLVKPEDIPHFADNICKESQRLIVLVGDIIKITQMDERQLPLQKERLNLLDLCRDVVEHLTPAADKQNVRMYLEGTPEHIIGAWQIADEMIYNLCDNAIKYNKPGGEVRISVEKTPQGPAVTVRDTGIGIPKEHQARVFERFYRVDKSHSKEIGGTGLGLSIVKHGAIYHNAAITMESTPGVGTAITVTFPPASGAEKSVHA